MCGRISLSVPETDLVEEFGVAELPLGYQPRYNIAPSQDILAIVTDADGAPQPVWLRWGLVPFWAKDPSIGNRMINARAETVAEKPAYRNALGKRRCLIPVDGFYEWQQREKAKVPMRIRLASGRPFALAGLWEEWGPKHAPPLRSCTILTTGCSEFMRPIHDRMPVILPREARERWLDPATGIDELQALMQPYAASDLDAYEVSTLVNSPKNDMPECLEPA